MIGKNIRKRLDELGMTQIELAERAGVAEYTISHYVTGRREPRASVLKDIAIALNTTPNDLLGFE